MVEDHADQLTRGLIAELKQDPRTSEYSKFSNEEIYRRVYKVYHDLGEWLGREAEHLAKAHYTELGELRATEGVPVSQVLYALIRTKAHLFEYISRAGLFDSAVDLYQVQEFRRLVNGFFDNAIYFTALAYERKAGMHLVPSTVAEARSA